VPRRWVVEKARRRCSTGEHTAELTGDCQRVLCVVGVCSESAPTVADMPLAFRSPCAFRAPSLRALPSHVPHPVQCEAKKRKPRNVERNDNGEMKLKIKLKSYHVENLKEACTMIGEACRDTGARLSGPVPLPTRRRIYCVLRSPHVNSNSREHFETRTHQRLLHVKDLSKEAIDNLMDLTLPAGVDCQVKL
jgi:small subunit ribosomal protein S10